MRAGHGTPGVPFELSNPRWLGPDGEEASPSVFDDDPKDLWLLRDDGSWERLGRTDEVEGFRPAPGGACELGIGGRRLTVGPDGRCREVRG